MIMRSHDTHASAACSLSRDLEDRNLADAFKAAFRDHPAGVAVITGDDGRGPAGLTATSLVSVSAEPALVAFSLSSHASATPVLTTAQTIVVHLLGADQAGLAQRFATSGAARFADPTSWTRLNTGAPLLQGVNSWLQCCVLEQHTAGTASVLIARVLQVHAGSARSAPLVYRNRTWYALKEAAALA